MPDFTVGTGDGTLLWDVRWFQKFRMCNFFKVEYLIQQLQSSLPIDSPDMIMRRDDSDRFTVKVCYENILSFRLNFFSNGIMNFNWDLVWLKEVPSEVNFHVWLVVRNRVLALENLQKRGIRMAGKCVLCEEDSEDTDHLFGSCSFVASIWNYFYHQGKYRDLLSLSIQN